MIRVRSADSSPPLVEYNMNFIDLKSQYDQHKTAIDAAIHRVLDHGQYILGPEVTQLESELAAYIGSKHSIAAASGTTALQIAMMALDIGPGDEVITSPFSFFASASTILLVGATPVFVDICPDTYNMDSSKLDAAITKKTKAIMPVSLYGQCADIDEINAIAKKHHLPVIEDAAQSFGGAYKQKNSCNLTTIACTSFYPAKPYGAYGDAGAAFTNSDELASKMKSIIDHGQTSRYVHTLLGLNGRCDTIQAAILLEKLTFFSEELKARQQVASWYDKYLAEDIQRPFIKAHNVSAFAQYTIRVQNRETLRTQLAEQGIPTAVHYPVAIHQQPIMQQRCQQTFDLPQAEKAAQEVLSLPFHPYLIEQQVKQVCEAISLVSIAA